GRGAAGGYCEAQLHGVRGQVAASHGLRLLDMPRRVGQAQGYDVGQLEELTALQALQQACACSETELPQHRLMAVHAGTAAAMAAGDYRLAPLGGHDAQTGVVTLAQPVRQGDFLCWAVRDAAAATDDLERSVDRLRAQLAAEPRFG